METIPGEPVGGRRADARRSRARLLEVARKTFTTDGVDVSFNELARTADVGPATLYRHFPRRDDLIAAVVGESLDEVTALAGELLNAGDPIDALRKWALALLAHLVRIRGLATEIVRLKSPDSALGHHCAAAVDAAALLVDRAASSGHLRAGITADDLIQLTTAAAWLTEQTGSRDADHLIDLLFYGITRADQSPNSSVN